MKKILLLLALLSFGGIIAAKRTKTKRGLSIDNESDDLGQRMAKHGM